MYKEISRLIIYGDMDEDSILSRMADIFRKFDVEDTGKEELTREIYTQIKRILKVATDYGFDKNLCEKVGANDGSVNTFAMNDFGIFRKLFHYDFSEIEKELSINCFSLITNYKAIVKKELMYNRNVSEKVRTLSEKLAAATTDEEFFDGVTACLVLIKHSESAIILTAALNLWQLTIWTKLCLLTLSDMKSRKRSLLRIQKHL